MKPSQALYRSRRVLSILLVLLYSLGNVSCFIAQSRSTVRYSSLLKKNVAPIRLSPPRIPSQQLAASTQTPVSSSMTPAISLENSLHIPAIVVGAGPAGLLTAIMLAQQQQYTNIHVYDRQPCAPPDPSDVDLWLTQRDRYYLIGLGGRGQAALKAFGLWDEVVLPHCVAVVGRKDWNPENPEGVERIFTAKDKKTTTQILPREKLVALLQREIDTKYSDVVKIHYGCQVEPLDFEYKDGSRVLVQVTQCDAPGNASRLQDTPVSSQKHEVAPDTSLCDIQLVETEFLVGADGTARTLANSMQVKDQQRWQSLSLLQKLTAPRPFRVRRYVDDNPRVYKTIPMSLPVDWRHDLNYSARTKGARINLDALPANGNGDYCAVLLLRQDDPFARPHTDPKLLREWMNEHLPQFSTLMDEITMAIVAEKPVSALPQFRYVGPRLHQGPRTVILGDCAHTVKPYFGLGANSALEDVLLLKQSLEQHSHDLTKVVQDFSKQRAKDSEVLVRLSRELDRPGGRGFVSFILPIILDSIFSGLLPRFFHPNIIAMMQREQYSFVQVARMKRFDRIKQVTILAVALAGMVWSVQAGVNMLAHVLKTSTPIAFAAATATMLALFALKKLWSQWLQPKLFAKITNSRTFLTPLGRLMPTKNADIANGESFLTSFLGFQNKNKDANNNSENGKV